MNYGTMKAILAEDLSAYDETISSDATKLGRWLNMAYHEILGEWDWWFLKSRDIIQTATDYTTGTVSVAAGGTAVTASAVISTSMLGRYIKFSSSDDWYAITAHTAGTAALTIDPSYGQTSALTNGTYTIRKLFYTADSSIEKITSIQRTVTPGSLTAMNEENFDVVLPLYDTASIPYRYMTTVPTSAGQLQFVLHPAPSSVLNLYVNGAIDAPDFSSDTDVPIFGARWHSAILDRAAYYGFRKLDDTRSKESFEKSVITVSNMKIFSKPDSGRLRAMRSIDKTGTGTEAAFTLPAGYGEVG